MPVRSTLGGVGFLFGVEDFKNPVGRSAAGEDHLVEGIEAVDRLVEERKEKQELRNFALRQIAAHHRAAAEGEDEHVAGHPDERHAGRVDGPPFHHPQCALPAGYRKSG